MSSALNDPKITTSDAVSDTDQATENTTDTILECASTVAAVDGSVSPFDEMPKDLHAEPPLVGVAGSNKQYSKTKSLKPHREDDTLLQPVTLEKTLIQGSTQDEFLTRYERGQLLGVGGMGEVHACLDRRIGREVALKALRPQSSENGSDVTQAQERFEREPKIQGQLEHPGVVPIYNMGIKPDGAAYFTMKRVQGLTLEQIIKGLAKEDEAICAKYGRRRLLTALSQVCLTMAYAHSRGVVHRDLKPSNVILGEFGEVYVLDWGIAKVAVFSEDAVAAHARITRPEFHDDSRDEALRDVSGSEATQAGMILGTPGYLAPEQIRGDIEAIDGRTDVYSLGVILFELLTLTRMIPRDDSATMLANSLEGVGELPSERAPERDIPPELDDICGRAIEVDPENRFQDVRQMHQAIEHYLDGARDRARRRELAQEHIAVAVGAIEKAQQDPSVNAQEYSLAIRELSSALALDPDNNEARAVIVRAFIDSTNTLTPKAEAELLKTRAHVRQRASKIDSLSFLSLFVLFPVMMLLGVKCWDTALLMGAVLLFVAVKSYLASRSAKATTLSFFSTASNVGLVSFSSVMIFGPYFVLPGILLATLVPMIITFRSPWKERAIVIAIAVTTQLIPIALMWVGVIPQMVSFADGVVTISPWVMDFPPLKMEILIILFSLALSVFPFVLVGRSIDELDLAERRLFAQTWSLRNLVPAEARGAAEASLVPDDKCARRRG